jgi:hypothetical protein
LILRSSIACHPFIKWHYFAAGSVMTMITFETKAITLKIGVVFVFVVGGEGRLRVQYKFPRIVLLNFFLSIFVR